MKKLFLSLIIFCSCTTPLGAMQSQQSMPEPTVLERLQQHARDVAVGTINFAYFITCLCCCGKIVFPD